MPDPEDIGPKPEPEIEPGEPSPGGADAIDAGDGVDREAAEHDPTPHDLDPEDNPAVEDALPDEVKQSEDTDTAATKDDGKDVSPEDESPA
jgi:hypothetical protein